MSELAIKAENISKRYSLGETIRQDTLRDALAASLRWPFRIHNGASPVNGNAKPNSGIWALRDVSFEVERGAVLGIIGRNGAGKSTLLKILSRITEPTSGTAEICGRVGSLLEVGTGFHPELTGRENIYLNGAILGMKRTEIARKFDEIVAFAEIEKFLETPVKRYSSGMYVRLAFAVAAHLEPEILLVDEVLAVGDAGFQKKCLGKMGSVAGEGRTVLFVSHNMAAVQSLCPHCLLIHQGRLTEAGASDVVVKSYLSMQQRESLLPLRERTDRNGTGQARFVSVRLLNGEGFEINRIAMGSPLTIEAGIEVRQAVREPIIGFLITDEWGKTVARAYSRESYPGIFPTLGSSTHVCCHFSKLPLMYGNYQLRLWLGHHRNNVVDDVASAARLEVLRNDVYATGIPPDANNGGCFYCDHDWEIHLDSVTA